MRATLPTLALSLAVLGCGSRDADEALTFDFEAGLDGFIIDQTDFEEPTRGEVEHAVEALPDPHSGRGLRVTSFNRSDDQWVYLARELGAAEGVEPSTDYDATIEVAFLSAAPSGCIGVGGGPDAVHVKAGVVDRVPEPVEQDEGYIGFSIDKGNQSVVGPEAVNLGTIGTAGTDCTDDNPWERLIRSGSMRATSDDQARLWLYVGTDSGFESGFTMYYDQISVTLRLR